MATTKKNFISSSHAADPYGIEASSSDDLDGMAATEMTGLIPRGIEDDAEEQAYENIFPYNPQQYVQEHDNKSSMASLP